MENKYLKILMTIIVVIILIIILTIFLILNMSNNLIQNEISNNIGETDTIAEKTMIEKTNYYIVRNCINEYLSYLNEENSIYYIGDEKNTDIQKSYIKKIVSTEYLQIDNIKTINEQYIFIPLQMEVLPKENINKYIVYGIIQTVDNKFIEEAYFIVNIDKINKTYSIEPLEQENINIDKIENNNVSIKSNDINNYTEINVTDEYVIKEYFQLYKRIIISKPEIIYNMMSKEYRELRFGNLDDFEEYINNNIEEIKKINLKQYLVNEYEDSREYVGKDQFGNLYIFNENTEQEINIKIDTYTIATEKFIKEYESATEQEKVKMNIDKFVQMINRHDYTTAYNCISEGFKNNYFSTQVDFENTMKNNFFNYNKIEFKNFEKKGSNIYVCTVQLSDITEENQELRDINIIMQLNDGLDFEMSFGI